MNSPHGYVRCAFKTFLHRLPCGQGEVISFSESAKHPWPAVESLRLSRQRGHSSPQNPLQLLSWMLFASTKQITSHLTMQGELNKKDYVGPQAYRKRQT